MGVVQIVLRTAVVGHGDQIDAPEICGSACPNLLPHHIDAIQIVTGDGRTYCLCCANALRVVGISAVLAIDRLGGELVETVIAVAGNGGNFGDPMEADASMGKGAPPALLS